MNQYGNAQSTNNQYQSAGIRQTHPFAVLLLLVLPLFASGCRSFTAHALNAEGVRRMERGQVADAANYFQRARATDPDDADSCYNMAILAHQRAVRSQSEPDFRQAEEYYRQCLDRNPSHADCYRGLAVLYADEGRVEDGFLLLESWATQDPGNPEPKIELARLYNEYNRLNRAEVCLQQALAIDPNNVRALNGLGYVFEQKGMYADASAVFCRSLQIMPRQQAIAQRQNYLAQNRLPRQAPYNPGPQNCGPCNESSNWSAPTNAYRAPLYCQASSYPVGSTLNGCPVSPSPNECVTPVSCAPQPACPAVCATPAPCAPRPGCCPVPVCERPSPGTPQLEPTNAITPEELARNQQKSQPTLAQRETAAGSEQVAGVGSASASGVAETVPATSPAPVPATVATAAPGANSPKDQQNQIEQTSYVTEAPTSARY